MIGQPSPFPWWLWILAGLWTGGIVLRRVWPVGREARWFLNVLIAVYTVLLAYMAATATTGAMDAAGWMRLGWWSCGAIALAGGLWCALGITPRGRTLGWCAATVGLAALAAWLHAPEMALVCIAAGIVGALRPSSTPAPSPPSSGERAGVRGRALTPVTDATRTQPDAWLIAVTATIVCVTWLGALEFALRTEAVRAGVSPRVTALPSPERVRTIHEPAASPPLSGLLLAGVMVGLAILEARPRQSEDRAA